MPSAPSACWLESVSVKLAVQAAFKFKYIGAQAAPAWLVDVVSVSAVAPSVAVPTVIHPGKGHTNEATPLLSAGAGIATLDRTLSPASRNLSTPLILSEQQL